MADAGERGPGLSRLVTTTTGVTFAIFLVDRLIQVAFLAVLARTLQPAEFGVVAAAAIFVSLVGLAAQFGVGPAIIQAPALSDRALGAARTIATAGAAAAFAFAQAAAPLVAGWFRMPAVEDVVRVLSLTILAHAIALSNQALTVRGLRARSLGLVELGCGMLGTGAVAVPLALAGFSYWSLIIGLVVQAFAQALALLFLTPTPWRWGFDMTEIRRLLLKGQGFSLTLFLHRIAAESDRWIIGRYLTAMDLGLYARANGLMALPAGLYGSTVDRVAFPAYAQVQAEPSRLTNAYARGLALTALVGGPATVLLFILGPEIIHFVLGAAWAGAVAPFKLLALAAYFRMTDRANGTLLRGAGRPYLMAAVQTVAAGAMILGCLAVVEQGLTAVAGVVLLASIFSFLALTGAAIQVAGSGLMAVVRAHGPALAASLLTLAVAAPAAWAARQADWSAFATLAAVGGAVAIVALPVALALPRLFLGSAGMDLLATLLDVWRRRGGQARP